MQFLLTFRLFSKAFDRVPHHHHCSKLSFYACDLPENVISNKVKLYSYADDTVLYNILFTI